MTTTQQIIKALKLGYHVDVRKKDGDYTTFSHASGQYRYSAWNDTQEEARQSIGYSIGYSQEKMEQYSQEENWQIIDIWMPIPEERFKEGDKVKVRENAKDIVDKIKPGRWVWEMDQMVGKVLEIDKLSDIGYWVYTEKKLNSWSFPPEALIPVFEEEEDEVEKAIKLLESKGRIVAGRIIK